MRGLLLPCFVIEVLVRGQQEMVFAAEDGGIYVRRFLILPLLSLTHPEVQLIGRQPPTGWKVDLRTGAGEKKETPLELLKKNIVNPSSDWI